MCKMRIISLKDEMPQILETLTRSHCFEVKLGDYKLSPIDNAISYEKTLAKQARLNYAIEYLNKQNQILFDLKKEQAEKYGILPLKKESVRPIINADEFFAIKNQEDSLLEIVSEIDKISFRQNDIRQEINKIKEEEKGYQPFLNCPLKFSIVKETKKTCVMLFSGPKNTKINLSDIPAFFQVYMGEKHMAIVAIALISEKDKVVKFFNENGFTICPYKGDKTAQEAINQLLSKQKELEKELDQLFKAALEKIKFLPRLRILYDYYSVMLEQYSLKGPVEGKYITIIEGWCPTYAVDKLKQEVTENTSCAYFDIDLPNEEETVPTLLKNNSIVQPFEDLTEMYTVSSYKERDPNAFMAFWYFVIFGLMLGDAVYGIVLFVATTILLKVKKFERGTANLIKIFRICSISTFIWGFVFGSFAGQSIPVPKMPLSFASADSPTGYYFGWFNPLEQPIILFVLGLIVGILHLVFGYGLKFADGVRNHKYIDAICDGIFPALVLISIFFLGANIFAGVFKYGQLSLNEQFLSDTATKITSKIGINLLLAGLGGMVLTTGRGSLVNRNLKIPVRIGGYIGGALSGLNGLIGIISDILSYSRIFGLGLAGAAIGFAFNTLIQLTFFSGGPILVAIGILLMLILHIFNLGISLLSTYVHNARLQFLEFYGKFLVGEGKAFTPLGIKTKYIRF